jgi:hypothetical protein
MGVLARMNGEDVSFFFGALTRTCKEEPLQFSRSFAAWRALLGGVGSERHVALELLPGGVTFGGASENGHYGYGRGGGSIRSRG